ncbi:MAG: PLP-dependent aminotransferase family protein [Deltaproteobacteria bacterium]|nr:PLP-dependent aminotransferase family protein [Deltaproteobacteria bacterium]
MDVHVSLGRPGQLAADAYQQLRAAILDGRLRPDARLPATRDLARRLAVSRNTIVEAYERLIAEGFAVGRVGAGTFVTAAPPPPRPRRAPPHSPLVPRAIYRAAEPPPDARAPYDFALGVPDPALFPWDVWRGLIARQWRGRRPVVGYAEAAGDPALRAAIARHVGLARGIRAGADDIVITSGAQQAFDLIARAVLEPGQVAAVEEPGYPGARRALAAAGARVVGVRVDADGLDVTALPDDARLIHVTPSHQFPLGAPMSLARRVELLAWAEARGAAIIEDDYDSEFRFDGRPLEPLQCLDRRGHVLYVGTFSKVLSPSLRLGFVVAPGALAAALASAKACADGHAPIEPQRALAALIDDGQLARHVRRVGRIYRDRRARLLAALARELPELAIVPSVAGLHVSAIADRHVDTAALVARARAAGVAVHALAPYYAGRPRAGLALGYGLIPAPKIDAGVRRLAACLHDA